VIDGERRVVAFRDETTFRKESSQATAWKWSFGDGETSTEQNPVHRSGKGGDYIVTLEVESPEGTSRREKIWDVSVK
jgi:PKD repeat protein